jgi:hypothetical protein
MLECKKNPQLDLRKDQLMMKILGYAFVFMICNIVFSFTIYDKNNVELSSDKLVDEATEVILRCPSAPKSPPMPKPVFINDFKKLAYNKAIEKNCQSIMIGHIHTPEITKIENINYYNTGDFCENCSYCIETLDGNIVLKCMNP